MAVFLLFAVTWSQATIPDMKENLKTEKLKHETSVKMVKPDVNFTFQRNELGFILTAVIIDYNAVPEKSPFKIKAKSIQINSAIALSVNSSFRAPRDALRQTNKS